MPPKKKNLDPPKWFSIKKKYSQSDLGKLSLADWWRQFILRRLIREKPVSFKEGVEKLSKVATSEFFLEIKRIKDSAQIEDSVKPEENVKLQGLLAFLLHAAKDAADSEVDFLPTKLQREMIKEIGAGTSFKECIYSIIRHEFEKSTCNDFSEIEVAHEEYVGFVKGKDLHDLQKKAVELIEENGIVSEKQFDELMRSLEFGNWIYSFPGLAVTTILRKREDPSLTEPVRSLSLNEMRKVSELYSRHFDLEPPPIIEANGRLILSVQKGLPKERLLRIIEDYMEKHDGVRRDRSQQIETWISAGILPAMDLTNYFQRKGIAFSDAAISRILKKEKPENIDFSPKDYSTRTKRPVKTLLSIKFLRLLLTETNHE